MSNTSNPLNLRDRLRLSNKSSMTALAFVMSMYTATSAFAEDGNVIKLPTVIVREKEERKNEGYQSSTTNIGKTNQALKDIPQSITVVNRNLMDDKNATTLRESLRNVSGLTFNAAEGGRIGDNINIRGFGASSDLYQDGVRDNAQYNRDTFNTERVEVLKGPSSMLFGRGSTGGLINQVSKEAELNKGSKAGFIYGSHNYKRETLDVNQDLGTSAAARINIMKTDSDSNRDFVRTNSFGVAPTVKWGIGEKNEYSLGYSHLQYDDIPDLGIPIAAGDGAKPINVPNDKFYGMANDYQKDSADTYTGKWNHKINKNNKISTILKHVNVDRDLRATNPSVNADQTIITRGRQARGAHEKTTTLQTNYTSKFDTLKMKHETLLGVEYLYETADRWSYFNPGANPTTTPFDPNPYDSLPSNYGASYGHINPINFKDTDLGIYAQDIIEFVPHWKLLLGGRYDDFSADYRSMTSATGAVIQYGRNDRVFSYRSGLMYQPDDYSTYYASYGTAFNPSGDLYAIEALNSTNAAATDPEKSINMELGGKWELIKGKLSLSSSLFRTEKTNERNTDQTNTSVTLLSGRRHTDGVEFQLSGKVTNNWEVFGGATFMKSQIDKNINPDMEGLRSTNTPTVSGNLWNTYRLTEHWRIGGGADFIGERQAYRTTTTGKPDTKRVPAYVRFDAMLEWTHKQYAVKLNVNNLLDREYYDSIYPNGGWATPGTDRTAQLSFNYKF